MSAVDVVPARVVRPRATWEAEAAAHRERADRLTAGRRERTARGEAHPVDDFLFTYYSYKPAVLRRWHPGPGVDLADAAGTERADWRWYGDGAEAGSLAVDVAAFVRDRGALLVAVERLLRATAARPGVFGCLGLHEWAMVYRAEGARHDVPLRLGRDGTDAVVEAHELRCTHFDAYRFFTADAVPRNRIALDRASQSERDQPGCLHANMDLYKWAVKLGPLVPGDVLLDAFELARDLRDLDMRASPYDLTAWGYAPIAIETADGKAEYVHRQRELAAVTAPLRARMADIASNALASLAVDA